MAPMDIPRQTMDGFACTEPMNVPRWVEFTIVTANVQNEQAAPLVGIVES